MSHIPPDAPDSGWSAATHALPSPFPFGPPAAPAPATAVPAIDHNPDGVGHSASLVHTTESAPSGYPNCALGWRLFHVYAHCSLPNIALFGGCGFPPTDPPKVAKRNFAFLFPLRLKIAFHKPLSYIIEFLELFVFALADGICF